MATFHAIWSAKVPIGRRPQVRLAQSTARLHARVGRVALATILCMCLGSLVACQPDDPRAILSENGFTVIGAPASVFPRNPNMPAWIDNDTVIFAAWSRGPYPSYEVSLKDPHNYFIPHLWKVSGDVTPYLITEDSVRGVCSVNGFVMIKQWRAEGSNHERGLQGAFGDEKPYILSTKAENRYWRQDTCRWEFIHPLRSKFYLHPLLPGHGHLNFGPHRPLQIELPPMPKAVLIQEDGTSIPLPVGWKTPFDTYCGSYSMYRQGYFYYRCELGLDDPDGGEAPPGICRDYFWLWPDGRTETGCVPYGPWATYVIDVLPTREGIVVINGQDSSTESGMFLLKDGRGIKIVTGWVQTRHAPAVSPDGCRITALYSHDIESTTFIRGGFFTVIVADVCKTG